MAKRKKSTKTSQKTTKRAKSTKMASRARNSKTVAPENNEPWFLKLPYNVRRKIYMDCGLIDTRGKTPMGLIIAMWSPQEDEFYEGKGRGPWVPFYVSNQLFFVSRAVSDDALHMFYAENGFLASDPHDLTVLGDFSPRALSSLTSLAIEAHPAYCELGLFSSEHQEEWDPSKPTCCTRFAWMWDELCSKLAAHIQPFSLSLRFDIEDHEVDPKFTECLIGSFMKLPSLKACSIRFKEAPDLSAKALIRAAVCKLTSPANDIDTPFRFNDLPADIKLVVLEHAGLVAPGDVILSTSGTYLLEFCVQSHFHEDWRRHDSICNAVYNAYDSAQPCWTFPLELFQVNRELRKLSQSLFYSRNTIVLQAFDTSVEALSAHAWEKLPRDCLQPVRRLKIRFCELENFNPFLSLDRLSDEEINSWVKKIEFISQHIQLDMLTLVLELDHNPYSFVDDDDSAFSSAREALYRKLIEPMAVLKGLQDLFIQIYWPAMVDRERVEQDLERMVMGQEYDSFSRGKPRELTLTIRDTKIPD